MPQGALQIYGTDKLQKLGDELLAIGGPTARGIRSHTRKAIVTVAKPIQKDIQAAYLAVPVKGDAGSTGLRKALARATQIKVLISSRSALVRIWVNPARMPVGKSELVAMFEGLRRWRKPLFGNREYWYEQTAHPTFYPTARKHEAEVRVAAVAAVKETLAQLPRRL